jgi:hypothetical protein
MIESANQTSGCAHNTVVNNISLGSVVWGNQFVAYFGCENPGTKGSGNVYTNNAFGAQGKNFIEWGQGTYYSTYSAWETAAGNCGSGGCSHSVTANPLFTNPSIGDFTLQAGSLAIGAGVYIPGVSTANPPNIGAK